MPLTKSVLVLDNNAGRGKACADSFCNLGWRVHYWERGKCISLPDGPYADRQGAYDCVILHVNDLDKLKLFPNFRIESVLIKYSGGMHLHRPENEFWIRSRAITSAQTALTPGEARSILDWAANPDRPQPPIMCEPLPFEILSALSILCQGYLAAHTAVDGESCILLRECGDSAACRSALDRMGWFKTLRDLSPDQKNQLFDPRLLSGALTDEVRRPAWWNVFGDPGLPLKSIDCDPLKRAA